MNLKKLLFSFLVVTLGLSMNSGAQASTAPAYWSENEFIQIDQVPSTFKLYVSSSDGSDTFDGSSPELAVKSFARAIEILQSRTYPYYAGSFQLLLKRGDVFLDENLGLPVTGGNSSWIFRGLSESAPIVIAAYGDGARPRLSGYSSRILRFWSDAKHILVQGLEFNPVTRDITHENFDYFSEQFYGIEILFGAENIRIEDCVFKNLSLGVYLSNGGSTEKPNRIKIFRNSFAYNWALSEINYGNRSFGILGGGFRNVEINQNIFYRNGWHPLNFLSIRTGFSHNVYLAGEAENLKFEDNFSVDASSMGLKIRSANTYAYRGMKINRNVFIKNPIGMGLGVQPQPDHLQYADFEINDNLITENGYVGSLPPYGTTNWGFTFGSGINGEILRNLLVQNMSASNAQAVRFDAYPNANVRFAENLIYQFAGSNDLQNLSPSGLVIESNVIEPSGSRSFRDPSYRVNRYCQDAGFHSCDDFFEALVNRPPLYWDYIYETQLMREVFRSAYSLQETGEADRN